MTGCMFALFWNDTSWHTAVNIRLLQVKTRDINKRCCVHGFFVDRAKSKLCRSCSFVSNHIALKVALSHTECDKLKASIVATRAPTS